MTPEQRKLSTEAFLKSKNIPYIDWLPHTEADENIKLREAKEVGERILCLFCLSGTAFNEGDMSFIDYLKESNLWEKLSKEEKNYLSKPTYNTQSHTNATWRLEALYLLLWAANVVPTLSYPTEEVMVDEFIDALPRFDESPEHFIESIKLRPVSEIMDASDLIYRLHWASREYGDTLEIDSGIVQERHHAINWLTNYDGENWDWVSTDT